MSSGEIIQAKLKVKNGNEELWIEVKENTGWFCSLDFNEPESYQILSIIPSPGKKDPNILIGMKILLLDHPKGGTLAPIAAKWTEDSEWIYKKEGGWCKWM